MKNSNRRAFIGIETVVSIGIMMLIAGLATKVVLDYMHTRDHYVWRQSVAWAAAGQLQRYQAGAAISSMPPEGLWHNNVTLKTAVLPGEGQWGLFDHVTVTAEMPVRPGKTVREQISGYVARRVQP